jgi:hypothetical protein
VTDDISDLPSSSPPSAAGNAGPWFGAKVGAFYLLSLLSSGEPRGLPGATARGVRFQQAASGRPLDDVTVQAVCADGSPAFLELQAKRTLDFTSSDAEFKDVVRRMWLAAQTPEFTSTWYELAVAISRTSTRIERACQEVLHWARHLTDGGTFVEHINQHGFASQAMRDFVGVFRKNLGLAGAPMRGTTAAVSPTRIRSRRSSATASGSRARWGCGRRAGRRDAAPPRSCRCRPSP